MGMSSNPELIRDKRRTLFEWLSVAVVAAVGLVSAIYPVTRIFYNFGIGYNEGWNVYNAARVAHHVPLYSTPYTWTQVMYPAFSFYIISWLQPLGLGYLMTGRVLSVLSLAVSCLLVGLIVWRVTRDRRAGLFAGFLCLAIFCNAATSYVGLDDPQILAQSFFLGGLLVYISGPPGFGRLAATSLLFIVGGNIKHNLIGFPLAVLVDLCFVSRKKVAQYLGISASLLVVSIAAEMWANGPYFITKMLMPRTYSLLWAMREFVMHAFGPLQLPLLVVAVWSIYAFRNTKHRIFSLFFWLTVFIGFGFGGGYGVALNTFFDLYLSISILFGLFLHWFWESGYARLKLPGKWAVAAKVAVPLVLIFSLAPSWFAWSHRGAMDALPLEEAKFQKEVAFLRSRPGPAICESILMCEEAGKPYLYAPFNSVMLVEAGKLDERPLLKELNEKEIGAVEFHEPLANYLGGYSTRFTPAFAKAVLNHYDLALDDRGCQIYVPKTESASLSPN